MKPARDARRERAKSLEALGLSTREIAREIGVSQTTILRWLVDAKQRYDRQYKRPPRTDYHREYQRKRRAARKNCV